MISLCAWCFYKTKLLSTLCLSKQIKSSGNNLQMRVLFRNQNNYQSAGDDDIINAILGLLEKLVLSFVGGSVAKYLKHSSFTVRSLILI